MRDHRLDATSNVLLTPYHPEFFGRLAITSSILETLKQVTVILTGTVLKRLRSRQRLHRHHNLAS